LYVAVLKLLLATAYVNAILTQNKHLCHFQHLCSYIFSHPPVQLLTLYTVTKRWLTENTRSEKKQSVIYRARRIY